MSNTQIHNNKGNVQMRVHTKILVCVCVIMGIGAQSILFAQNAGKNITYTRVEQSESLTDDEFQMVKNYVRISETYRGNAYEDFYYKMKVVDSIDKEVKSVTEIKVNVTQDDRKGDRNSLSLIESGNSKGNKILQKGTNMWYYKPGTANAIRISPAQRFIGGASYADVSATNYTLYYDPISIEETKLGNTNAYKIELKKIKEGVSYDLIILYIEKETKKPVKSEFFTRSGKLVKTMYFRKFIDSRNLGKPTVLASEWVIVDNLNTNNITTIQILDMRQEKLDAIKYTADGLKE